MGQEGPGEGHQEEASWLRGVAAGQSQWAQGQSGPRLIGCRVFPSVGEGAHGAPLGGRLSQTARQTF